MNSHKSSITVFLPDWRNAAGVLFVRFFYKRGESLLLLRLWNYLRGYVIIIVEGFFVEKFINICTRRQILLWDIRVQKEQLVTMRISIKGFRLIRPIAGKTKCRVRILKKVGLPFILNRYRRRKAFLAGAILFVALIYVMTSFIWKVEITGIKELQSSHLEQVLAENGIKSGVLKYRIDTKSAVTNMMLGMEEISWISINVRGTKVKVEIRERRKVPEIIPMSEPCDIVALKDGMIKQVIAKEGIEAVGEGDTVKKGQVLISGKIPLKGEEDHFRMVHAMGTTKARTWYESESAVLLKEIERVRTGKVLNNHSLILFSWKLDILHKKNKFKDFTQTQESKVLSLGENLVFPIEWSTNRFYEEKLVEAVVREEDAREQAVDKAYRKVMEQLPEDAEIVKKDVKFVVNENSDLLAKVVLECVEDIGTSRRIGGN